MVSFLINGGYMVKLESIQKLFKPGATVAFSLMPVGAKFSWIGNPNINVKTSPFSAESVNGLHKWSAIDMHFMVNDLVTFWE